MELRSSRRNSMITDTPRIEEPEEDPPQEDVSSISTTRGQVGSPISSRTRSFSGSDIQQAPLTPIPEEVPAPEPGQHARYYRLDIHEDFILYSHSDTDDGTEEPGSNAYLSPQRRRTYRRIAPRSESTQTQSTQVASSSSSMQSSSMQTRQEAQQDMTPQRQLPSMHMQLPTPSQTNMMPYFEREAGPWSPTSPIDAESRKRALSAEVPDIDQYPKDRHGDDKMQGHFKKIEQGHGGEESSDEEKKRLRKRRRRGLKKTVSTRSMAEKKDDKPRKDDDQRGGEGGEQAFMVS